MSAHNGSRHHPAQASAFASIMGPVARELLGEPTATHRARRELRWGTRESLSVDLDKGTWHDHEAGTGGGVLDLLRDRAGLDKPAAIAWLQERGHLPREVRAKPAGKREVEAYRYPDEAGALLFEVVRFEPKDFRQRRPDGHGGWAWNMAGVRRVPYRLPELLAAVQAGQTVFVAEGEKGADALARLGRAGTCSPGGAGKWRAEYGDHLAGARVVILPDNDDPGRAHAAAVAAALRGKASVVQVLHLPGLPPKGDVADWIEAGGTADELDRLARDAPAAGKGDAANVVPLRPRPGDADLDGFELTEDGVALAFAARHAGQLRYCHDTRSWYEWTGAIWQPDRTRIAFTWTRQVARDLARPTTDQDKRRIGRAGFAAGVETFAQADRAFAVTSETWDRDPFLLGTPAGTVELRTGELRPGRQSDFITKQTVVAPIGAPDCPLWLAFLDQATGGDQGLIRFLRQWCGYSLTGDTREHALLFGFGPGGNGKSVFINTVAGIMGGYALTAGMETFTASKHDRHSTELARLRGARMVTASETEEGRAWAETRIKQLTGGDPITARFMKQDDFTFRPQFKLTIVGNNKPTLQSVDEAARRRFNVVPFLHKPDRPDTDLEAKLRREWPAILRWMIEGSLDWQRHGLVRPEVVRNATAEYFEAQDHFGRWLAERCDLIPTMSERPSNLLHSFTEWCQANGEPTPDNRKLRGMIEKHDGLRYATNNGVQWVRGIVIRPDA